MQDLSLNPSIHPARSTQVAALSLCLSKSTELQPARNMDKDKKQACIRQRQHNSKTILGIAILRAMVGVMGQALSSNI